MERTPEQIAEDNRLKEEATRLESERAQFAAEQDRARASTNASLVDGLVTSGKVLPADAPALKLVFNALAPAELEFSADRKASPAAELARILGTGVKLVAVNDGRQSPRTEFTASADEVKGDPKKITAAARKLMSEDKSLTFEAAVEQVTGQEG